MSSLFGADDRPLFGAFNRWWVTMMVAMLVAEK